MIINFYQPPDASRDGVLVIDGEIMRSTGRLDALGSRIFVWGLPYESAKGKIRLLVQCERASETTISAEITAFGKGGVIVFAHQVSDVPLAIL